MTSPYLESENRLADVVAAIQATGSYKYYKLDFATWSERISGSTDQADHWEAVFKEHPEFFRLNTERTHASLVIRRQRQKLYNVDDERLWTKQEYKALADPLKVRFSRAPLEVDEIQALVKVAIELHARAESQRRERRWLVAPALALVGALLGGILAQVTVAVLRDSAPVTIRPTAEIAVPALQKELETHRRLLPGPKQGSSEEAKGKKTTR